MKCTKVLIMIAAIFTVAESHGRCHSYDNTNYHNLMYSNNMRVNRLQALIVESEKEIARVTTELPGWEHGKMSCGHISSALYEALTAVDFAVKIIESAAINISYFEDALNQLGEADHHASVSEALRQYANSWNLLWPSQRQALLEFASAIDVVAAKDEAWRKSEQAWIKEYIDLQKPAVEDYIVRLKDQRSDLAHRISEAERSCQGSTDRVQVLTDLKAKLTADIAAYKAEQTQLALKNREYHAAKERQRRAADMCAQEYDKAPK